MEEPQSANRKIGVMDVDETESESGVRVGSAEAEQGGTQIQGNCRAIQNGRCGRTSRSGAARLKNGVGRGQEHPLSGGAGGGAQALEVAQEGDGVEAQQVA